MSRSNTPYHWSSARSPNQSMRPIKYTRRRTRPTSSLYGQIFLLRKILCLTSAAMQSQEVFATHLCIWNLHQGRTMTLTHSPSSLPGRVSADVNETVAVALIADPAIRTNCREIGRREEASLESTIICFTMYFKVFQILLNTYSFCLSGSYGQTAVTSRFRSHSLSKQVQQNAFQKFWQRVQWTRLPFAGWSQTAIYLETVHLYNIVEWLKTIGQAWQSVFYCPTWNCSVFDCFWKVKRAH